MRELYLRLEVPDEVDPEEVVETMSLDYYYGNREVMEERFPDQDIMSKIIIHIVKGEVNVVAQ
jgi:hypothetical protein